jgi:hypothetical protein
MQTQNQVDEVFEIFLDASSFLNKNAMEKESNVSFLV